MTPNQQLAEAKLNAHGQEIQTLIWQGALADLDDLRIRLGVDPDRLDAWWARRMRLAGRYPTAADGRLVYGPPAIMTGRSGATKPAVTVEGHEASPAGHTPFAGEVVAPDSPLITEEARTITAVGMLQDGYTWVEASMAMTPGHRWQKGRRWDARAAVERYMAAAGLEGAPRLRYREWALCAEHRGCHIPPWRYNPDGSLKDGAEYLALSSAERAHLPAHLRVRLTPEE
jgi:hypothetical protein